MKVERLLKEQKNILHHNPEGVLIYKINDGQHIDTPETLFTSIYNRILNLLTKPVNPVINKNEQQPKPEVDLEYFNSTLQNMFEASVTETYRSEISRFGLFSLSDLQELKKNTGKKEFITKIYLKKMPFVIDKDNKTVRALD